MMENRVVPFGKLGFKNWPMVPKSLGEFALGSPSLPENGN